MSRLHIENHLVSRIGWLRAAVLGANDGLISTGSLVLGMATAQATPATILLSGLAGLVAGALSMAAGEYVSVSSQSDAEEADIRIERAALEQHPEAVRQGEGRDIGVEVRVAPDEIPERGQELLVH